MKTKTSKISSCSCAAMCGNYRSSRRLLVVENAVEEEYVYVKFVGTTDMVSGDILDNLHDPVRQGSFNAMLGISDPQSLLTLYGYTGGDIAPSEGGTVVTLIEFQNDAAANGRRRLLESRDSSNINSLSFGSAVTQALSELIGPLLPLGSSISTVILDSLDILTANVSVVASHNITSAQNVVAEFLASDSDPASSSYAQLPRLVSSKSDQSLNYAPGYIPIVWSSSDETVAKVLNLLPYIVTGVVVVGVLVGFLVYRYRFVIQSWLEGLWYKLKEQPRWFAGRSHMHIVGHPASLLTRGKSAISSTPDTDTNVDADEFDAEIMRNL